MLISLQFLSYDFNNWKHASWRSISLGSVSLFVKTKPVILGINNIKPNRINLIENRSKKWGIMSRKKAVIEASLNLN
jgi:hypothetical protein